MYHCAAFWSTAGSACSSRLAADHRSDVSCRIGNSCLRASLLSERILLLVHCRVFVDLPLAGGGKLPIQAGCSGCLLVVYRLEVCPSSGVFLLRGYLRNSAV